MSNLQDVPLAEPESLPNSGHEATTPKSNSLKRFFKMNKKPNVNQESVEDEGASALSEDNNEAVGGAGVTGGKPNTLGRLLTRIKGSNKMEASDEGSTSPNNTMAEQQPVQVVADENVASDKPLPNAKPTLKMSISTYWKLLFHRQKSANRSDANPGQRQEPIIEQQDEVQELQVVQHEQELQSKSTVDDGTIEPSAEAKEQENPSKNLTEGRVDPMPKMVQNVEMLNISDDVDTGRKALNMN